MITHRGGIGALLCISWSVLPGQNPAPKPARVVGIVIDSIHRSGLPGADVIVSGIATSYTTDSLGRFAIESLPPGTYRIGVFHPLLESLGISLATKPFTLGPDSTGDVSLAIPSATTLATRYCGSAVTPNAPAVVAGKVLDPDDDHPVSGANVSLAWVDMIVSKQTGVVRTPHELHATSDSVGFFKFCGLPEDLDATVQATNGGISTGEVAISTHESPLTFENLAVPSPRAAESVRGTVRGTVLSLSDRPIEGARVEAPMWGVAVVTGADGTFTLDKIPTGTQLLIIRHVGFEPTRAPVNVTSRQPTEIRVVLGPRVNVLDPVLVSARRKYALEQDGFVARQRTGEGKYFTAEDIQKRNPGRLSDILTAVPGITVSHLPGGAVVREQRTTSILGGRSCTRMWVDGHEWRAVEPGDLDVFVSPHEIVGMEVYRARTAPVQFRGIDDCTVIVVWTQLQSQVSSR